MADNLEIDFSKVKTYSLKRRASKVYTSRFCKVVKKGVSFRGFYNALPKILAANDLKEVVDAICRAYKNDKMVIFMLGAHVIKCGLNPIIIDLMKKGFIKALALNGACIVHDVELAMIGHTSEDVGRGIKDGSFGMAKETARFINTTLSKSSEDNLEGVGDVLGKAVATAKLRCRRMSLLYWGFRLNIPITVHIAIGTDVIHQHPSIDGAEVGKRGLNDFRKFIKMVAQLGGGGVVLNIGSAVILPEVFLKAVNMARNLGFKVSDFVCANFDMHTHYRPTQNVLLRPTANGMGRAFNIIGHHEIMLPLLHLAILESVN